MVAECREEGLIWCAIPVHNNGATVREVAQKCRALVENVVVVDDGSTDVDLNRLMHGLRVTVLRHDRNLGKGQAIITASRFIESQGGAYMITIDADGQHDPADILKIIPALEPDSLIIGCRDFGTDNIPGKSRFGRKFANFWLFMETGQEIDDCQSGFRAYPVRLLNRIGFTGVHYDFEAEVLAKAAWAGLKLKSVSIKVFYPRECERVTSFRPFVDNLRFTLIHTMLIGRKLLPWGHRRLVEGKVVDYRDLFNPIIFFRMLMHENTSPKGLAMAAALGAFLAILPLLFVHTIVILYFAVRLNLNKVVAVNVQHLFMPPFVPAICIEIGYFLRHGRWLTDISFATIFSQASERFLEWLLGSFVVAPVGAFLVGIMAYILAAVVQRRRTD